MKKNSVLRKVLAVSLAAAMLAGTGFTAVGSYVGTGVSVSAAETQVYGDFKYGVNEDNTVTVTKYTGNGGDVVIPSIIDKKIVTSIGEGAFRDCTDLTNVIIPNCVTSIGRCAFLNCTGLTSITIPDSVTLIDIGAFSSCTSLTSITIPDSVVLIGTRAFSVCKGLTSVTIPDSVISIGKLAFMDCTDLTSINVSENNTEYSSDNGVLFNKNKTNVICCPGGKKDYVIPNGVTSIDDTAFYNCTGLKNITIPDSVTSIGESAFNGCEGLTSITIPDSVTFINSSVFSRCTSLKNITIPNSVTSIGEYAFYGTMLKSIIIPDSVTSIGEYAFRVYTGLKSMTIPKSVTEIGKEAIGYSDTGEKIKDFIIFGAKGSAAETYANENDIQFVSQFTNTSAVSADEIVLGDTVTVYASVDGGNDNYTYAVLYKKKTDTKWVVKQNYSTNDTITVKPAKADDYDICVKVKDGDGNIKKKFFTVIVNAPKLLNKSTISKTEIKQGETVIVNGSATGGMGNYIYAVYYKKKTEAKWTTRQGYKDNSEILVRPYTNTDYDICIKVKDETGTIAKKYFTVTVTK